MKDFGSSTIFFTGAIKIWHLI